MTISRSQLQVIQGRAIEPATFDEEAEKAVLGALLIDPEALSRVAPLLTPEDFYREGSGQIYRAALGLFEKGEPIDVVTLGAALKELGHPEEDRHAHLYALEEQTPTAMNVEHYARRVAQLSRKRHAISAAEELTKALQVVAGEEEMGALIARHAEAISSFLPVSESVVQHTPSAFPVYALPGAAATYVAKLVSNGLPAEYLAPAALAVMSTAIGGKAKLVIDAGSWSEPLILWYALLGRPGTGKSPSMRSMKAPLEEMQKKWALDYDAEYESWAAKKDDSKPPSMKRTLLDDATIEAVAIRLGENPAGMLQASDELGSLIHGLGQYKKQGQGDVAKFLSLWSSEMLIVDRIRERKMLSVEAPVLNVLGGIQPEVLDLFNRGAGLRDRFLISHYTGEAPDVDDIADSSDEAGAWRDFVAQLARYREYPQTMRLSPDASSFNRSYRRKLRLIENDGSEPVHVRYWCAKAKSHLLRHALLLAVSADRQGDASGSAQVPLDAIEQAGEIVDYYLLQMRGLPVFSDNLMAAPKERDQDRAVGALVHYLSEREDRRATKREISRAHVGGVRTSGEAAALLARYEATYPGHVRVEAGSGGAREVVYAPGTPSS